MRLERPQNRPFQDQTIPRGTRLAGLSALVDELSIAAPLRRPSAVSEQHIHGSRRSEAVWTVFDKRYWPGDTVAAHLTFALRHEETDLLVLKRIFEAVPQAEVEALVREASTALPSGAPGTSMRRSPAERLTSTMRGEPTPSICSTRRSTLQVSLACRDAIEFVTICSALDGSVLSFDEPRRSSNSSNSISRQRRATSLAAPAATWSRARPVSCCWPIAAQASRLKENDRRGTGWSDGVVPCCRQEGTS